jgi:hypothetical protein
MRTELGLLAAVAVIAGLGLLASSGPPRPTRGSVVLNRAPPPASASQLIWQTGTPIAAGPTGEDGRSSAAAQPQPGGPDGSPAAQAGIWATPAEFAASD